MLCGRVSHVGGVKKKVLGMRRADENNEIVS